MLYELIQNCYIFVIKQQTEHILWIILNGTDIFFIQNTVEYVKNYTLCQKRATDTLTDNFIL